MVIEYLKKSEYREALDVVLKSFWALDAKDYSHSGKQSFLGYANLFMFRQRQRKNHISFCAKIDGSIVGMLELRESRHISMLFVSPEHINSGIGSALINRALEQVKVVNSTLQYLTVNSSPYAVHFYGKQGFVALDSMQNDDGFYYTPMALSLT